MSVAHLQQVLSETVVSRRIISRSELTIGLPILYYEIKSQIGDSTTSRVRYSLHFTKASGVE
ncbi:hypothetical protein KIN20_014263 [Parelaphostrongylus tenuis]|uniref:Uncharacterized protein n=1 Tax=Parelaphostrongylus tenuis TaxID=148309 RepID=A0AAD5QN82_PARTN|nr:hypothetical protein KIN20_014263 [Parelaphostrongylus tenuis]